MNLFKRENKINILEKTQENLETSQKNVEALLKYIENKDTINVEEFTEEEKRRAAYALNYCMVSVSQIVDYDDKYVLEQEYEHILNNLNLEVMPKDEALLNLFKQLLDTITFFRIQEFNKRFLEREYQRRLNNAIWNAAPDFGVIIAGGDLRTIAISLATQVGIGYMNYRREKSDIILEHKQEKRKLEISAMEQFNGLKREIFTAAWRLADKYNFKDEYRITERQISQFNKILLDIDPIRRYERLDYIKDCFKAYPPFWYYLGNSANQAYQEYGEEEWKYKAKDAYEKFKKSTDKNILREDYLMASCALECFELEEDKEKRKEFLDKARAVAGNTAYDILQICAVSYIQNNNLDEAIQLLKWMINEEHNTDFNCKLLSRVYVRKFIEGDEKTKKEYEDLSGRIKDKSILFPMPSEDDELSEELKKKLKKQYFSEQKRWLKERWGDCIARYVQQCEIEYEEARDSVDDFLKFTSDMIKVVGETTSKTFSTEEFLWELKEKTKGKRNNFSEMAKDKKPSFEEIYKKGLENWAKKVSSNIESANDELELSNLEEKYYNLVHSINIKSDSGLNIETRDYYLDKELFPTDEDQKDKIKNKIRDEVKSIWEKIEPFKEKVKDCEKIKVYNWADTEAEKLMRRIKPNSSESRIFNTNDYAYNVAAVLTVKERGVGHRLVLHMTTKGILIAKGEKIHGCKQYEEIKIENKYIKIGDCKFDDKYDHFDDFKELISEIIKISNQNNSLSGIAKEIKDLIAK